MFCKEYQKRIHQLDEQLKSQSYLLNALNRSSAVIEFDTQGVIQHANENFLSAVGYQLHEIVGEHHRLFVSEREIQSKEYRDFWHKLAKGEFAAGRFQRIDKNGHTIWLEASYNPVVDPSGQVVKVVKVATNITDQVEKELDATAQIEAIHKVMAVIEFDPTGRILSANDNFLKTMGYGLDEIVGKHHSMFVDPSYVKSQEYQEFWERLSNGESCSATYQRLRKGGEEVWLEASYNPILDADGQVVKVIKYATDVGSNKNTRLLDKVIEDASTVICRIANGDLTTLMENHLDPDEVTMFDRNITQLRSSLHVMISRLTEVLGFAKDSAELFRTQSGEISNDAAKLTIKVQDQANSVQNTALAANEVSESVSENANAANDAYKVAGEVQVQVKEGVSVMNQTVEAMSEIQESSHKISDIVSLIDGIAFQTNLLALNAAVEAARAGEHGRGFAVVAGEVRSLAQKSAEAAKEIRQLIEETVTRVDQGVKLANTSGEMLNGVNDVINSVTDRIQQIAQASVEQSNGVQSINDSVTEIDTVTQENAVLVKETSNASNLMEKQAMTLEKDLSFFKINKELLSKLKSE